MLVSSLNVTLLSGKNKNKIKNIVLFLTIKILLYSVFVSSFFFKRRRVRGGMI